MAVTQTAPSPSGRADVRVDSPPDRERGTGVARLHAWADTLAFLAGLNLLVLLGTLAGGVLLGLAPSLAAAVTVSRKRIRGEAFSLVGEFVHSWRAQLRTATLLQLPSGVLMILLTANLWFFTAQPGATAAVVLLAVAGGIALVYHVLLVAMDAHYELHRRSCRRLAAQFLVRFPGAPLLLGATTALVVVVTGFIPGLLPVISLGAWLYVCTALCLSFFAANDRSIAAAPPHPCARHDL